MSRQSATMETSKRTIATTATIDAGGRLVLDTPLPLNVPNVVHVFILLPDTTETEEKEWLRSASHNPAFDFLKDAAEDIYTITDGRAFDAACAGSCMSIVAIRSPLDSLGL